MRLLGGVSGYFNALRRILAWLMIVDRDVESEVRFEVLFMSVKLICVRCCGIEGQGGGSRLTVGCFRV